MAIAFKNPPINEVIVSTYFNPPLTDFRNEHIGLFWTKIKEDFPAVKQQIPVGVAPDIGPVPEEFFPMPRYWFIAGDDVKLIQIQKNAFMFNWRRRDDNEYPRYHGDIKPAFDKYYGIFDEFIRTEVNVPIISIDACELTYVNTMEPCAVWKGPQDTPKIIPASSTLSSGVVGGESAGFVSQYAFNMASDLQLMIGIRAGTLEQHPETHRLVFDIKASGKLGGVSKSRADEWFERAHDAILECFEDMTSLEVREQHWIQLKETP